MLYLPKNEFFFTFRGTNPFSGKEEEIDTRFLEMAMKEKPEEQLPSMKSEELDYDSIDGALYVDNNTFKSTEIEFEFYIKADREEEVREALRMLSIMNSGKITYGWDSNFYKVCRLNSAIEINEVEDDVYNYECVISFTLNPYKYAIEGDEYVRDHTGSKNMKHGSRIKNFYDSSFPLIYLTVPAKNYLTTNGNPDYFVVKISSIDGSGNMIPGTTQELKIFGIERNQGYNRRICIDCLNGYAYATDGNYGENMNHLISIESDFPILKPGMIMFSYSQNFISANTEEVNVIPNWRKI